ncbi:MAG: hypothetical protein RR557_07840 [Bacilli bacterium]
MFLEAFDMGYITVNPTRNIKITDQKHVSKSTKTLSFDDMLKFKDELTSYQDIAVKYFLLTQMMTGARYQEVTALTWDDILYNSNQINIDKAKQNEMISAKNSE